MNKKTMPYAELLKEAVTKKGVLSSCYSRFHRYSFANQIWAWAQSCEMNIPLAPIATLKQWNAMGRKVKKGASAIFLNMPVMIDVKDPITKEKTGEVKQLFMPRKNWFFLSQTEGDDYVQEEKIAEWDKDIALKNLNIDEVPFTLADGNCQGYAEGRSIAINPVAILPHKTRFHEIAHIVLGHTLEHKMADSELTPRDIREVEAESVAYILCQLLGLKGEEESRGYIQSWLKDKDIEDASARKIFSAVDKILKSGQIENTI
jgi:antirestriction protein ArdC